MKCLQVVQSYYPATVYGGPIFSIHYQNQSLVKNGIHITVATTNANGTNKLDYDSRHYVKFDDNYLVRYYNDLIISRFSLDFIHNLWGDVKKCDVIHLHDIFSTYALWTLMLSLISRKPILISPRGSLSVWALKNRNSLLKRAWLKSLIRPMVVNSGRVRWHATSEAEEGEILNCFPDARVEIVANGIDISDIDDVPMLSRDEYRRAFFPDCSVNSEEAIVIAAMGRIHPKKAFDVAISALDIILKLSPCAVLLIAGGDDGARDSLEFQIKKLNLKDRVKFVGNLTNDAKYQFLKGANLFLFTSHNENFGMTCLEALACGLPVVASRATPWSDLDKTGAGLWVDNTPCAFAAASLQLLAQDANVISSQAKSLAARFDLASLALRFKNVYSQIINESKARSPDGISY